MRSTDYIQIDFRLKVSLLVCLAVGAATEVCWENVDCAMMSIFQTCFDGKENLPIVSIGSNNSTLLRTLQTSPQPLQVALLDSKKSAANYTDKKKWYLLNDYTEDSKPQPSSKFLFDEIDLSSLESAINNVYHSVWWNLYGNFVFKNTLTSNTCQDAYAHLKIAWKFDILKATYICRNSIGENELYTFNPFTNYMSNSWEAVQTYKQKNNHPFTLFKMMQNLDVCTALSFHKTSSLGGYPIRMVAENDPPFSTYNKKAHKFISVENSVYEIVWDKLNATPRSFLYSKNRTGSSYSKSTIDGMLAEILQGNYDYLLAFRPDELLWKNQIYLHLQIEMCFVTQKQLVPARLKISNLINFGSFVIFGFTFNLMTLSLMYLKNESFGQAAFNLLRLILNIPTTSEPTSHVGRLVFTLYLTTQIVLTNIQQGDLYSAITAPPYEQSIDRAEDLLNLNYKIYSADQVQRKIYHSSPLFDKIQDLRSRQECIDRARYDYKSACIDHCQAIKYFVSKHSKIHISKVDEYFGRYRVFVGRNSFSLHRKVSSIFLTIQESGIANFFIEDFLRRFAKKNNETRTEPEPITSDQISFALFFIMYGWTFSSVVLLIEILFSILTKFTLLSVISEKIFL